MFLSTPLSLCDREDGAMKRLTFTLLAALALAGGMSAANPPSTKDPQNNEPVTTTLEAELRLAVCPDFIVLGQSATLTYMTCDDLAGMDNELTDPVWIEPIFIPGIDNVAEMHMVLFEDPGRGTLSERNAFDTADKYIHGPSTSTVEEFALSSTSPRHTLGDNLGMTLTDPDGSHTLTLHKEVGDGAPGTSTG